MTRLLATLFCCLFLTQFSQAQFESGAIAVDIGVGVGAYGATTNDPDSSETTDGINAAAGLFNVTATYSIIGQLAVGANFERNGFLVGTDSTNNDAQGQSLNYRFVTQFRMVNSEKNSLSLNAGIGYSSFNFTEVGGENEISGGGLTYDIALAFNHYFGDHVGFFLQGAYGGYKYKELVDQDGDIWKVDNTETNYELGLGGVNLRIGLALKF